MFTYDVDAVPEKAMIAFAGIKRKSRNQYSKKSDGYKRNKFERQINSKKRLEDKIYTQSIKNQLHKLQFSDLNIINDIE